MAAASNRWSLCALISFGPLCSLLAAAVAAMVMSLQPVTTIAGASGGTATLSETGAKAGSGATFAQSAAELNAIVESRPYALVVLSKRVGCPSCERYERLLQENLAEIEDVYQCSLTIVRDNTELVQRYGLEGQLPRVLFFREGVPALYYSPELLPSDLFYWVHKARDARVELLDDSTFEHLTQATTGATTGDWLVAFVHRDTDTPALRVKLEGIQATLMGYGTTVAVVDIERNANLRKRFSIDTDTLLLFKHGKMFRFRGTRWEPRSIMDFVAERYSDSSAETIPLESSMFDYALDMGVRLLHDRVEPVVRQFLADLQRNPGVVAGVGLAIALLSVVCCACLKRRRACSDDSEVKRKKQQ